VVKLSVAEALARLPAETPAVSPAQRESTMRARRNAALMRKRW
jgi:hypothetical protein